MAFEKDPLRSKLLKHNMSALGVSAKVTIKCGDSYHLCQQQNQKLVFVDPPWGGPDYKRNPNIELFMSEIPLWKFCKTVAPFTQYIAVKAPTNFNESKFIQDTSVFMNLVHKNVQLRKMHFYVFEVFVSAP
jgi:16S rRNA G966 N2-methylase RsmD